MSLPKPYYDDQTAGITLYHGDCRNILPLLGQSIDVVLTDPPYGIAWTRGVNSARNSKAHNGILNDEDTTVRDEVLALLHPLPCIVFGSFYAPFPECLKQVLVWHKPTDAGLVGSVTGYRRDAEPIFLTGNWPQRSVERSSVLHTVAGQGRTAAQTGHPHTKPLSLVYRLLQCHAGTVLDPFAGSGTTLVAAKQLGRKAIGIEIEERYCEIAVKRLAQGCLELTP